MFGRLGEEPAIGVYPAAPDSPDCFRARTSEPLKSKKMLSYGATSYGNIFCYFCSYLLLGPTSFYQDTASAVRRRQVLTNHVANTMWRVETWYAGPLSPDVVLVIRNWRWRFQPFQWPKSVHALWWCRLIWRNAQKNYRLRIFPVLLEVEASGWF